MRAVSVPLLFELGTSFCDWKKLYALRRDQFEDENVCWTWREIGGWFELRKNRNLHGKDLCVQKYESNTYYWVEGGWDFWGTDSMMETQWPQKKTLLTNRYSTTKTRFILQSLRATLARNLPVSVFFFFFFFQRI